MIIIYANFVKNCNKKLVVPRLRDHLGRENIKLLATEGLERKQGFLARPGLLYM